MPLPRAALRRRRVSTHASLALWGAIALGCSVPAEEAPEEVESTHAAVRVQHVTLPSGEARGDALAGFVRVPGGADASQVLALAGLDLALPEKGECFSEAELTRDLASLSEAELLQADVVTLEAGDNSFELAPYAFPSVADLLRGVVYLSRDRSASLPADSTYTLSGAGIDGADSELSVSASETSPPPLSGIVIEGQALTGELTLPAARVLDLSWDASENENDIVVVTLDSGSDFWACSFQDDEGFGSVPLLTDTGSELGQSGREALLAVHRVRSHVASGNENIAQVRVTFDFAVEASVVFDGDSQ